MIRFQRLSFRKGEKLIQLDIGLDESAVLDGAVISVEVAAILTEPGRSPYAQTMNVEVDVASGNGRVKWTGLIIYEFNLGQFKIPFDGEEERIPDVDAGETDIVGEAVSAGIGQKIGEIINAMPVPDPIFGCALKAGISSVIGQTIACREMSGSHGTIRQRARRIFRCLLKHTGGILSRAAWRYVLCVTMLG